MPDRLSDLTREAVHGGIKPRIEQNGRIDLARLGVICCAIKQMGQIAQKLREDDD
jgi:hypothetical protein